jgi:ferredoxin--NADP+ reductase
MYKIIEKEVLSENVVKLVLESGIIARNRKAGQFVIVKLGETGERIPLTIADSDPEKGTITLVIQKVGATSHKLYNLNVGDTVTDLVGPLGRATEIEKVGTVVAAGGGVGIAPLYPIAKALKEAGNRVVVVLAARSKDLIILEDEMRAFADEVVIMTDDGSYGKKGLVTQGIEEFIKDEDANLCVAIGPAVMMKFVALLTKKYDLPTVASLNTIMVDGTGMCGACRISVGGKTKFVCVDGPEFDAHQVDFDEMLKRLNAYKKEEEEAYSRFLESLN